MQGNLATWLMVVGAVLLMIGLLIKAGVFSWFGQLPGDLHIKRESFQFFFPLTTMIVVSIILSLILAFVRKFF